MRVYIHMCIYIHTSMYIHIYTHVYIGQGDPVARGRPAEEDLHAAGGATTDGLTNPSPSTHDAENQRRGKKHTYEHSITHNIDPYKCVYVKSMRVDTHITSHTCVYRNTQLYVYIHIYIYIYRERERER